MMRPAGFLLATLCLTLFSASTTRATSTDVEIVRDLLIPAWTQHLDLRKTMQYDYEGFVTLPEGSKEKLESKR